MRGKNFPEVRLRGGFSDRNGLIRENTEMQYENLDKRTRTRLINGTDAIFQAFRERCYHDTLQNFMRTLLAEVYCVEVAWGVEYRTDWFLDQLKATIRSNPYYEVLSLLEYFARKVCENAVEYMDPRKIYNHIFEKEYVGYRFVNWEITRITDRNEMEAIEQASDTSYQGVNEHMQKALSLLANREKPDYENSIKESISAVEAICEYLTGGTGKDATLGRMLKKLEDSGVQIHSAMKSAFHTLYGYTNDANGIRHAGDIGGPSSTFEEAKFMLVSCSAFINYLIGMSAKI